MKIHPVRGTVRALKRGFTLIELLAVIAIISILSIYPVSYTHLTLPTIYSV